MKQRNVYSIVTIVLCIVILGSVFFPFLSRSLTDTFRDSAYMEEGAGVLADALGALGVDVKQEIKGVEILRTLTADTSDLGKVGQTSWLMIRSLLLVQCISAILLLILCFIKARWADITSLVAAIAGALYSILSVLLIYPFLISKIIKDSTGDVVSAVVTQITDEGTADAIEDVTVGVTPGMSDIRNSILHSMGPAFWIAAAALVLLIIICVMRVRLGKKMAAEYQGDSIFAQPSFQCSDGPLAGEVIPFTENEEITFGSDPEFANMVFDRRDISPTHCKLSYIPKKGKYCVLTFDSSPVLVNGKKLKSGENYLKRGTEIFLGYGDCSIILL